MAPIQRNGLPMYAKIGKRWNYLFYKCAPNLHAVILCRVARFFLVHMYIPKRDKYLYHMTTNYSKWSWNIPTSSIHRPSKVHPNWDIWYERRPSGKPDTMGKYWVQDSAQWLNVEQLNVELRPNVKLRPNVELFECRMSNMVRLG
jgi:hypothetical protein